MYHQYTRDAVEYCMAIIQIRFFNILITLTLHMLNFSEETKTYVFPCIIAPHVHVDCGLSVWGKMIIPMYRLWLSGLYGLYGPRCPLSPKRPINLISLSLHDANGQTICEMVQFPLFFSSSFEIMRFLEDIFHFEWWSAISNLCYMKTFKWSSYKFYCTGVNTLWPNDTIWRQRSGSTLAQVMACCLTAPSRYLHQCWLTISEDQTHSY